MLPTALTSESFGQYPPEAKALAVAHAALLRQLPLAFLPSLLQELIEYDYKFPAERTSLKQEVDRLAATPPPELRNLFADFWKLHLTAAQENVDWVNRPVLFTEQFSAYLWSTHQMDAFRSAATRYGQQMHVVPAVVERPAIQRLGIAVIGQGVSVYDGPLFAKLRPLGTSFSNVQPDGGLQQLIAAVAARAEAHPVPYGHWYVDGGTPADAGGQLTHVSYAKLEPVRVALLNRIQQEVSRPGMGPEELRNTLARLTPADLGFTGDPVLNRFQLKVLTEGSGTQIFSTTFAQWTAREALRRAAPDTLLVRFAPRQRQRPMDEMLSSRQVHAELDPLGSLIDADMAAWYHYVNQQRLPGHERAAFIAWFEGGSRAVVIGPSLPRGAESKSSMDLASLLSLVVG